MLTEEEAVDSPLSVLLVEEDAAVAELVASALRLEGYLVIGSVASVSEARRMLDEEEPDIIVLDHQMIPLEEFGCMEQQNVPRIRALLAESGRAHRDFEQNDLAGASDEDWPGWYARYLLAHGLDRLIGRELSEEELRGMLGTCDAEFRRQQPQVEWPDYYARRILTLVGEGEDGPPA